MGALLREGLSTLRADMEAGPDPSCCPIWASAGRKLLRKAVLGGSALFPPVAAQLASMQGYKQPLGNFPSSPSATGFSPQQGFSPTDTQDEHFSLKF